MNFKEISRKTYGNFMIMLKETKKVFILYLENVFSEKPLQREGLSISPPNLSRVKTEFSASLHIILVSLKITMALQSGDVFQ